MPKNNEISQQSTSLRAACRRYNDPVNCLGRVTGRELIPYNATVITVRDCTAYALGWIVRAFFELSFVK